MRRTHLLFAAVLALAGAPMLALADKAVTPPEQGATQLSRIARPVHYDVSITPHARSLTFDGKVTVAVDVLQPARNITLNAADMTFHSVSLTTADGRPVRTTPKIHVNAAQQTVTLAYPLLVPPGRYLLTLRYTGRIGTQAAGLFAVDYTTTTGPKRALFTQFEEAEARRFIPSWDEPAYKATFTLQVVVPSREMAVSNMPVATAAPLGHGLTRVTFQTTPRMSTYLLFFALGDFERATTMLGKTQLGVITQRGMLPQAAFALASAKAVLAEYNDYFGTPYPLPKLDNIAAPGRSRFSAMENWGAIFSFETVLLLDPTISTEADRQRVFSVLAHEMAHQWFGDLVTMRWWDDIWLNEGFASWMGARTVERLHPEWQTDLRAVATRESAMERDGLASTHPVVQPIATVEQARLAFDSITYSKGRAVLDMLEDYVGPGKWREGVRAYIRQHAYGNAVSDDLWNAVQEASDAPILDIAHDFTTQPGIPLIQADLAGCSGGKTRVKLTQGEFTRDRPEKEPLTWSVPVVTRTLGDAPVRTVVEDGHATLEVPGCGPLIVNAGQRGYYRTLYGPAGFAAIRGNFGRLAPIDQLGILADTYALGLAGDQPPTDFLELIEATPADAAPQLWQDIAADLVAVDKLYRGEGARQAAFRKFAIATLRPELARIGWDARPGDSDPVRILRLNLIDSLGTLGDPAVVSEARHHFAAAEKNPASLPAALRKTVLGVVARNADAAEWDRLHAMARAEKSSLVREQLYILLATSRDATLARRALDLALGDEPGATLTSTLIHTVAAEHPDLAFDFAVEHKREVDERTDPAGRSGFYPELAANSLDPTMPARVQAFAEKYIATGSRRGADTTIATIKYRLGVRKERLPAIDAWLKRRGA